MSDSAVSQSTTAMAEVVRRGCHDRAAMFLHGLSREEMTRYAAMVDEPLLDGGPGPVPNIFTTSAADIQDWLYRIWVEEEAGCDDPLVSIMPFRDWLVHVSQDSFYQYHFHARFYLAEAEPELPI